MKRQAAILTAVAMVWAPFGLQARATGTNAGANAASSAGPKERYQKQVEEKLRELDREIAALEARVPSKKREVRKQLNRQMADLNKKREAAERELIKFKNTSRKAWQDAKPGLDAALKDLEIAYDRAASDFKENGKSE